MGKGKCMYDSLKNPQNYFQNSGNNLKKNFLAQNFQKTSIIGLTFDKSSEPAELNRHRDARNSVK